MAGFANIIRSGVAIADKLTDSLQPKVRHAAWIGNDGEGGHLYAAPVLRPALVERKQKTLRSSTGEEVVSTHYVAFLRPIKNNGAAGRQEPIDPRDKITLPDGTSSAILTVNAFVDKDTGSGYFHEVYLG